MKYKSILALLVFSLLFISSCNNDSRNSITAKAVQFPEECRDIFAKCINDKTSYWIDNCGNKLELKEECSNNEVCIDGLCVSNEREDRSCEALGENVGWFGGTWCLDETSIGRQYRYNDEDNICKTTASKVFENCINNTYCNQISEDKAECVNIEK